MPVELQNLATTKWATRRKRCAFGKGIIKQRATTALQHALVITVIRVVYHRTTKLNAGRYTVE